MLWISRHVSEFLQHPLRIFWICVVLVGCSLTFNGNLLHLYSLYRNEKQLRSQIDSTKAMTLDLVRQLKQAQEPSFIARQAVDRYDLAEEHDLIFVFSED